MKKTLLTTTILFAVFAFSCKVKHSITWSRSGCWYEAEIQREICGATEAYNAADSTYTMRTFDGWAVEVSSSRITWK